MKDFYNIPDGVYCYQENDIIQGVRYLLRKAEVLDQPIVICIGVGTNGGNHNGNIALSTYLNKILNVIGVAVVSAAGNETNRGHHYMSGNIASKSYEDVELRVAEKETGFTMELWVKVPNLFSVGITSPSGEFTNQIPIRTGVCQRLNFILDGTKVCVNYNIAESYTGDEVILIHFERPRPGIWRFHVYNENFGEGNFNIWLPMEKFILEETAFLHPDPNITICEPGNTLLPITCATYNHVNDSIYLYSSRGYTSSGTIKPDITAPGVNIYGPLAGGGFTRMTGSSIAAAHVAGVAAILFEWGLIEGNNMDMRGIDVKNLLIKGAQRKNIIYPNREWGYGTLDAYGAFENLRTGV